MAHDPHLQQKFPRIAHLLDAGGSGVTRDDLLLSKADAIDFVTNHEVIVEEKIDGANLGFWIDADHKICVQNRSHRVSSATHSQFRRLDEWIRDHSAELHMLLEPCQHILFGEWMYAKHSLHYTRLPGLFVAFDIFDIPSSNFLSVDCRNAMLAERAPSIPVIREITRRRFKSIDEVLALLDAPSSYKDGCLEGLMLRIDNRSTSTTAASTTAASSSMARRCKLVRPDFVAGITDHWTHQTLTKNTIDYQ